MSPQEQHRQAAAIERWLRLFHPLPGEAVELRALTARGRGARPELFADPTALSVRAVTWDALPDFIGCYFPLTPLVSPLVGSTASARKTDVLVRHWLPIDCDPIRAADTSSTDE